MKKFLAVGLILVCAGIMLFSCKKDKEETTTNNTTTGTVNAKWEVTGAEASSFTSFEFTKGGQYIVTTPSELKYGNFTISGSIMALNNFGSISISTLTSTEFNFTLTTSPKSTQTTYNISSTKVNEVPLSGNTALLCRTWSLDSVAGEPTAGTDYEGQVIFTAAGTYFIHYVSTNTNGNALWQWLNTAKDTLCYSWSGTISCDGNNEVKINKLTTSKLVMTEVALPLNYVLTPYIPTKSAFLGGDGAKPKNPGKFIGR
ncbi:MAG: hypothetical protein NTU98_07655 [Bacteroidetes bacterium]|nr:hypothetical protein [Bacteroidota bacterium]